MIGLEQQPSAHTPTDELPEFAVGALAYSADYHPTEGASTMKNVLDSARFALMENPRLQEIEWNDIIDMYWSVKPQIDDDPTGPLTFLDALSNVTKPENDQEKDSLDEMFLDAFSEIAHHHPDLVTLKSFLTGIHAIDKMGSKEHKEQALRVIESILNTLEQPRRDQDGHETVKIDAQLKEIATKGLREYRALLESDKPASLEETVMRPAQDQIEHAIAEGAAQHEATLRARSELSPEERAATPSGSNRDEVPELTHEQCQDLIDGYMFAKMHDKQRQAEWDAYYANGGSPVEDTMGTMDPASPDATAEELDPESTAALMRRELQHLEAVDQNKEVSRELLLHNLNHEMAARAVEITANTKKAS